MKVNLFAKERPHHLLYFPVLFVVNHFFAITTPVNSSYVNSLWAWFLNFLGAVVVCTLPPVITYKLLSRHFPNLKSALLATIIWLPFFFFQDLFLNKDQLLPGLRARWAFIIAFLLLATICYWFVRSKRHFHSFTQYLNIASFSLIIYTSTIIILSFEKLRPSILNYASPTYSMNNAERPDIYFFVLDSYTSNKSLRNYFNFDNHEFTRQLEELNFSVADQAISGYSKTVYSLAAILNLDQIKDLKQYNYGLSDAIQFSSVIKSLKKENYEIHNYSLFDVSDQPRFYFINPSIPIGFINGIVQSSILNMAIYDIAMKLKMYDTHKTILQKIPEEGGRNHTKPNFFYGHILAPHPPFVIDSNGEGISLFDQKGYMANPRAYVTQIKGLNKMVIETITEINKAAKNSIIIITGDHGYRYLETPEKAEESFTVFLAYRGPNKDRMDSLATSNRIFELVFGEKK